MYLPGICKEHLTFSGTPLHEGHCIAKKVLVGYGDVICFSLSDYGLAFNCQERAESYTECCPPQACSARAHIQMTELHSAPLPLQVFVL